MKKNRYIIILALLASLSILNASAYKTYLEYYSKAQGGSVVIIEAYEPEGVRRTEAV